MVPVLTLPEGARKIVVQAERPRRPARYHLVAILDGGDLAFREACNLGDAAAIRRRKDLAPSEVARYPAPQRCRRCFPDLAA